MYVAVCGAGAVRGGRRLWREHVPLTPESGLGYALGVCGGVTTLVLAMFAVRKRLRFMRRWGVLRHWFRVHMILGALAPVLVLFHCNFRLGAPNSNVALTSMLVVAASGVVGRFICTHISHGLYGARDDRRAARAARSQCPRRRRAAAAVSPAAQRLAALPSGYVTRVSSGGSAPGRCAGGGAVARPCARPRRYSAVH
jgi:hypothetical protein